MTWLTSAVKLKLANCLFFLAGVPYKKTEEQYTYRTIDGDLFLALVVLAALGLFYALICCIAVVLYMRKKR